VLRDNETRAKDFFAAGICSVKKLPRSITEQLCLLIFSKAQDISFTAMLTKLWAKKTSFLSEELASEDQGSRPYGNAV
jgi:hypothetical protein